MFTSAFGSELWNTVFCFRTCIALSFQYVLSCFIIHVNVHLSNQVWLDALNSKLKTNELHLTDLCLQKSHTDSLGNYLFCCRLCHVVTTVVWGDSRSPAQRKLSKGRMIRFRPIQLPGARQLTHTYTQIHKYTYSPCSDDDIQTVVTQCTQTFRWTWTLSSVLVLMFVFSN